MNDASDNASGRGKLACLAALACVCVLWFAFGASPLVAQSNEEGGTSAAESEEPAVRPKPIRAAWEYDPYRIGVWLVHDDSWRIKGIEESLKKDLARRMKIVDPSALQISFHRAPKPWNWRLQASYSRTDEKLKDELVMGVRSWEPTSAVDKLMIIKLADKGGLIHSEVREFDLQTKVWGAAVRRESLVGDLSPTVFASIRTAFMPVSRIESVVDDEVRTRVRAIGVSQIAEQDQDGQWHMVPNKASPAWIGDKEVLLPVVVRRTAEGNVESIKTIEYTFLTIDTRDGSYLNCTTRSMRRAPLVGRAGGRTTRLGLCVRPPDRKTTLRLISNDRAKDPLPGLTIVSRRPDQEKGTNNEPLGSTDWRGEIEIPPNDDPMRRILIASGHRPLGKIPMVPGLYDELAAPMPNDEDRLYAQGVIRGLENELNDLVAKRQVLHTRIEMAFEKDDLEKAEELLERLRDIPASNLFAQDLSAEKKRLLFGDNRQQEMIIGYFAQLERANSQYLSNKKEGELRRLFQSKKRGPRPGSEKTD